MKLKLTKIFFTFLSLTLFSAFALSSYGQQMEINDTEITNAVETELRIHEDVPSNMIDVSTEEGIVSLLGSTADILAKEKAEKIAMAVKGVRGVINNIVVAAAERSDEIIRTDVLASLVADPATDSFELDVTVDDGKVTLDGEVESWQEKQLAEHVAKNVRGVTAVENQISFDYEEDRSDYEIRQDIVSSLENDIRVDQVLIDVRVENGNVFLSGTVGSATEKVQATTLAYTTGVKSVDATGLEVAYWARDPNLRKDKYVFKEDSKIREAVKDALFYDPRANQMDINVEVKNGKVTLKGTVDNLKSKRSAEKTAKNIVGVTLVNNLIKVRPEIPDDLTLENNVRAALERNPNTERFEIMVNVIDGTVHLTGQVDSYFEKYEAEDVAAKIYGVTGVANNLEVRDYNLVQERGYYPDTYDWSIAYPSDYSVPVYMPPMEDENIKSSIESQLWWSPFVNEDEIQVEVDQGVATLSGEVATMQERRTAVKNAYEGGASAVINNIDVLMQ